MTKEQIYKEYANLLVARLKATSTVNYYAQWRISVLQDVNGKYLEYKELQEKIDSPQEEKEKLYSQIAEMRAYIDAAQEHQKQLERLHEKAQRKLNELDQKIENFCKRHGFSNNVKTGISSQSAEA